MLEDLPNVATKGELSGIVWLVGFLILLLLWPLCLWALRYWKSRHKQQAEAIDLQDEQSLVKIAYLHEKESEGVRQGYLRSLTSDRATLVVADRGLRKGSQLRLDLGALHPYSHLGTDMILGRVTRMKSLGGTPENLLVNIQFLDHNVALSQLSKQQETQ